MQVLAELAALGEHVASDRPRLADELACFVLAGAAGLAGLLLGHGADALGLLLGWRAQLSGRRFELEALGARLVDHPLGVLLRGGPQRGGLLARRGEDLACLRLGRPDAVVGGALALGDALVGAALGLRAQVLGGLLGRGDDRRDTRGRELVGAFLRAGHRRRMYRVKPANPARRPSASR